MIYLNQLDGEHQQNIVEVVYLMLKCTRVSLGQDQIIYKGENITDLGGGFGTYLMFVLTFIFSTLHIIPWPPS